MWLEMKYLLSGVGFFLFCVAIGVLLTGMASSKIIVFIIFLGFGLVMFGDIALYIKIKSSHADLWFEPLPPGFEIGIMETNTHMVDLVKARKGPEGKREWVYNKQEASCVVSGKHVIHNPIGNHGFYCHEGYDQDIDPVDCMGLEKLKGDDIEECYDNIIKERKVQHG